MKQPKRMIALSALFLFVMLAAIGAIAFAAPNAAHAQTDEPAPAAPTITAQPLGETTIHLSWNAVQDAARYELWVWDIVNEWQQLGGDNLTATSYNHAGLTSGTTYYYQVRALNADSEAGAWSARVNEVAGNAPARPVLTATAGYLQNTLSWPAVTGATSYELWAWDGAWAQLLDNGSPITGVSHTHTGLIAGRTYYYQGRAVNAGGVKSAWSAQVSASVLTSPNISPPTNFRAARENGQLTLAWGAPATTSGLTIASYEYRRAPVDATLPVTWTNVGNVVTTTVTGLINGTTYSFELRARSATGAEGAAASALGTPSTVPGAPALTAVGNYGSVTLAWTPPSDNGGAAISSYRLERTNNDGIWNHLTTVPGSVRAWTDGGRSRATEYTYRIFAVNAAGDSDWTSASAITLANPVQAPSPPTGLRATADHGKAGLEWGEPAFNGGAAVTHFSYAYKKTNGGAYPARNRWTSAGPDHEVEITGLTPGVEYTFAVQAHNSAGMSDFAESQSAAILPTGPTAAPTLRAILGDDGEPDPNPQITLVWSVVPPAGNGGAPISGYEIEYKTSDETGWTTWDSAVAGFDGPTADGSGQSFSAAHGNQQLALAPGSTYQYRVRAFNDADSATDANSPGESPDDANADEDQVEENGPWSNTAAVRTHAVAPGVPMLNPIAGQVTPPLTAWTLAETAITVRWTAPSNGGSPITSYQLRVSANDDANARFGPTDTEDAVIANLPGTRTEYTHTGLKPLTGYYYSIRALNDADRDGIPGEDPADANTPDSNILEAGAWSASSAEATTADTAPGAPATPSNPNLSVSGSTATLTWSAPADQGSSPITRYEVQYQRDDDNDDDDWSDASTVVPAPPTNTRFVHRNLEGGSRYEYRVRAVNDAGESRFTDPPVGENIAARAPETPGLTASAVGAAEILLEWNKPESNGTTITGYEIQQWNPDAGPAAWNDTDLLDGEADTANATALTVGGLDAGATYYFRIRTEGALQSAWSATARGDGASATTSAGAAPAAPSLLAMPGSGVGSITLTITPTIGTASYELQRWYEGAWHVITAPARDAASYTDSGLNAGVKYYYALRATNANGTGPWSAVVSAIATAGSPDPPALRVTETDETSVSLAWNVPADNGAAITGYELQVWVRASAQWAEIPGFDETSAVTQFIHTGLTAGVTYAYRIRALPQNIDTDDPANGTDDEGWSAEDQADGANPPLGSVSATTVADVPGAPALNDITTVTASSITITWDPLDVADRGGSAITRYEVHKWTGGSWAHQDDVAAVAGREADPRTDQSDYAYTDTGLAAGARRYYIVRAVNSQGAGKWSNFESGITSPAAPDAPVLTATARDTTSIQLTWTEAVLNGAGGFDSDNGGYLLQRWHDSAFATIQVDSDDDGTPDAPLTLDATTTLYVDTGLESGTQYWYRIRVNAETNSVFSGIAAATTIAAPPDRPVVSAQPGDISHNAVKLTWDAPHDNGSAVIHYELHRWDTSGPANQWTRLALISATRTSYTHRNLDPETRYTYRVRAQNRAPNTDGFGPWSTVISVTTTAAPPN